MRENFAIESAGAIVWGLTEYRVLLSIFTFDSPQSRDVFDMGTVFAYEPVIVRLGLGTAVVEDTVALTEDGSVALTECEKTLVRE